jgi:hypothetical protein
MPKIKLTSNSYKNFTGMLGTVAFENGVSVEAPSSAEANRLAALTTCEIIDEEGNEGGQAGLGAAMAASRGDSIPVLKTSERGTPEPHQVEKNAADVQVGGDTKKETEEEALEKQLNELTSNDPDQTSIPPEPESEPEKVYSKEELEQIADDKGIAGLRAIADPLNVKDNSIAGLIKEIINAQGSA